MHSFSEVIPNLNIDATFGSGASSEKGQILTALQTAYEGSSIFRDMVDDWVFEQGKLISIDYSQDKFQAIITTSGVGAGHLQVDINYIDDLYYIDETGRAVSHVLVGALVHELSHALKGLNDVNDPQAGNFMGENVEFVNGIWDQLGIPKEISYSAQGRGYDYVTQIGFTEVAVLAPNFEYTSGQKVEGASVVYSTDAFHTGGTDDLIIGTDVANDIDAGAGDDFVYGNFGEDVLRGGAGNDHYYGAGPGVAVDDIDILDFRGAADNSTLPSRGVEINLNFNNEVFVDSRRVFTAENDGYNGVDEFTSIEILHGTAHNDIFKIEGAADDFKLEIHGNGNTQNAGVNDKIDFSASPVGYSFTINNAGVGSAEAVSGGGIVDFLDFTSVDISGSVFADEITLGLAGSSATGGDGDDRLVASADSITLNGGAGNDVLRVEAGVSHVLNGQGGNDKFEIMSAGGSIDGGGGYDVADYGTDGGVQLNVGAGFGSRDVSIVGGATVDHLFNVEEIRTSGSDDRVTVTALNEFAAGTLLNGMGQTSDAGDVIDFGGLDHAVVFGDNGSVRGKVLDSGFPDLTNLVSTLAFKDFETIVGTEYADVYEDRTTEGVRVFLGDGNDVLKGAGSGTQVNLGSGSDVVMLDAGTNVAVSNFGNDDTLMIGDTALHGGTRSAASENPFVTGLGGRVEYGINVVGDLVVQIAGLELPGLFIQGWSNTYGADGNPPYVGAGNIVMATFQINAVGILQDWTGKGDFWATWELFGLMTKAATGTNAWGGQDPLVLDLDGDGFDLMQMSYGSPKFDTDADLYKEYSGWVGPDDGFLVRDIGGDGQIADSREMFGGATSGFAVLAALDGNSDGTVDASDNGLVDFNGDGVVDATDTFADLQIWQDLNQNGETDAGELKTLSEYGIVGIHTTVTPSSTSIAGNQVVGTSTFVRGDGTTGAIGEAILKLDNKNTSYNGPEITVSTAAAAEPDLKGYGTLVSLREALSVDPDGITAVDDALAGLSVAAHDLASLRDAIRPILEAWRQGSPIMDANGNIISGTQSLAYDDLPIIRTDTGINDYAWNNSSETATIDGVSTVLNQYDFVRGNQIWTTAAVTLADLHDAWGASTGSTTKTISVGGVSKSVTVYTFSNGEQLLTTSSSSSTVQTILNGDYTSAGTHYSMDVVAGSDLAFFERYIGETLPFHVHPDSASAAIDSLETALTTIDQGLNLLAVRLIVQAPAFSTVFSGLVYDAAADAFAATTDQQLAPTFANLFELADAEASPTAWLESWQPIIELIVGDFSRADGLLNSDGFLVQNVAAAYEIAAPSFSLADAIEAVGIEDVNLLSNIGTMPGSSGADIFYLSTGDQTAVGGEGLDNYIVGSNFGHDVIDETELAGATHNEDTVRFTSLNAEDVTASRDGLDLIFTVIATGDTLRINGQFLGEDTGLFLSQDLYDEEGVETIVFANGETWDSYDMARAVSVVDSGSTTVSGTSDNDYLDGGAGDDRLEGGGDGDTYVFGRGYGHDVISDHEGILGRNGNFDVVYFKSGITFDDISFSRALFSNFGSAEDLTIHINGDDDDYLVIEGQFSALNDPIFYGINWIDQIELFAFSDGTLIGADQIKDILIAQNSTSGDDQIDGFEYRNDIIDASQGDDVLQGMGGADTYRFGLGDGNDIIRDISDDAEDTVQFKAGISLSNIHIERGGYDGEDAVITVDNGTDSLTIFNQFEVTMHDRHESTGLYGSYTEMASLIFGDGTSLSASDLKSLYIVQNTTEGDDVVRGFTTDDTYNSSAGNDHFYSYGGHDTFNFSAGFGHDTIEDAWYGPVNAPVEHINSMNFGAGFASTDLVLSRFGEDLIIGFTGSADTITRTDAFVNGNYDSYHFSDNVTLGLDDLRVQFFAEATTAGDDHLIGSSDDDLLVGGDGNDTLEGRVGNDTLEGGAGNDTLDGGPGLNTSAGGLGDDIYLVDGGVVVDTLIENANEGNDTVIAAGDWTLEDNIENLILSDELRNNSGYDSPLYNGTGNELDNHITGNSVENELSGGAGNDWLDGGVGVFSDTLIGGTGDDTYIVRHSDDAVIEDANEGIDTVNYQVFANGDWSYSYTLSENVENLVLSEVPEGSEGGSWFGANGNDLDNQIRGNSLDNIIYARAGDDMVDGKGGVDEADFDGALIDYLITRNSDGSITVEDTVGTDGVDVLTSVEFAYFYGDGSYVELASLLPVNGTSGDDSWIAGTAGNDYLFGLEGDDTLYGDIGSDVLDGGDGEDQVNLDGAITDYRFERQENGDVVAYGDSGDVDQLRSIEAVYFEGSHAWLSMDALAGEYGTSENDAWLAGTIRDDYLYGLEGDDTLIGDAGNDFINGGEGDDQANYIGNSSDFEFQRQYDGSVIVTDTVGNEGTDTLVDIEAVYFDGDTSWHTVESLAGEFGTSDSDSWIQGTVRTDSLFGLEGDDTLIGHEGNDLIDGGADYDQANYEGSFVDFSIIRNEDGTVTVSDLVGNEGTDTLYDVESVYFEGDSHWIDLANYGYVFMGTADEDTIYGTQGSDTIYGLSGSDVLVGDYGNDLLVGGEGDDQAEYFGAFANYDFTSNTDGTVTVTSLLTGEGEDVLDGVEYLFFYGDSMQISVASAVALANGVYTDVYGTNDADWIDGDFTNENIYGLDGDDILVGYGGNDNLYGGAGDDQVRYNAYLSDYTFTLNGDGSVTIEALTTNEGTDTLFDVERLYFSGDAASISIADALTVSAGGRIDVLGTSGNDTVVGENWNENVYGLDGNDTLIGYGGDDHLIGGDGSDTAKYFFSISNYSIEDNLDGTYTVTDLVHDDGQDVLEGVEFIKFSNTVAMTLQDAIDLNGNSLVVATDDGGNEADTAFWRDQIHITPHTTIPPAFMLHYDMA